MITFSPSELFIFILIKIEKDYAERENPICNGEKSAI